MAGDATLGQYASLALRSRDQHQAQLQLAHLLVTSTQGERQSQGLAILHALSHTAHPAAQYALACLHASPASLTRCSNLQHSLNQAHSLFVAASKKGHVESTYRAACDYLYGLGTARDIDKGVTYLRKAAHAAHTGAMLELGIACLSSSLNLNLLEKEGVKWINRASEGASRRFPGGPFHLGRLYERGFLDIVFRDERYAVSCYLRAAALGHVEASYVLGHAFETGRLTCDINAGLSIHYYTLSAVPSTCDTQQSQQSPQSKEEELEWVIQDDKIPKKGYGPSCLALCAWYLLGSPPILQRSETEALLWALEGCVLGYAKAAYTVGVCYERGIGCVVNLDKALDYYVLAREGGEDLAVKRLTRRTRLDRGFEFGSEVQRDCVLRNTRLDLELARKQESCRVM